MYGRLYFCVYNSNFLFFYLYCSSSEQRQAHFRSISPSHPQSQIAVPQTGLGILMGSGGATAGAPIAAAPTLLAPATSSPQHQQQQQHVYSHLTADQQNRIQEDLADRERQAAALASAGMVAESVNLTRPAVIGQVLQAPPPLVGMAPPATPPRVPSPEKPNDVAMESINWNMVDLGNPDDMDMDFAAMFDPEQEQTFMTTPETDTILTTSNSPPPPPASTTSTGIPNPLSAND